MRRSENNLHEFKFHEQLSAQKLKSYFGKTHEALKVQYQNLVLKEQQAIAEDNDPFMKQLNSLSRAKLIASVKRLQSKYELIPALNFGAVKEGGCNSKDLRTVISNLIDTNGRLDIDIDLIAK